MYVCAGAGSGGVVADKFISFMLADHRDGRPLVDRELICIYKTSYLYIAIA